MKTNDVLQDILLLCWSLWEMILVMRDMWGRKIMAHFVSTGPDVISLLKTMQFPSHIPYSQDPCVSSIWFTLQQASHIYSRPYGRWDSEDQLIPWNSMNFAFFFFALFMCWESCDQKSKFRDQVWGRQQLAAPAKQIACCCADWGLPHTKHEKCGFLGPRAHVVGSAIPDRPGEKGTAQSAGQGHWSDEKIILPPTAAGPHAASNHLWAVTQPDWAERIWVGNFKTCSCFCERERICITHSDLMDFPMFTLDSPFLLTCSNNESLMCRSLFPPCSQVLSLVVG